MPLDRATELQRGLQEQRRMEAPEARAGRLPRATMVGGRFIIDPQVFPVCPPLTISGLTEFKGRGRVWGRDTGVGGY